MAPLPKNLLCGKAGKMVQWGAQNWGLEDMWHAQMNQMYKRWIGNAHVGLPPRRQV